MWSSFFRTTSTLYCCKLRSTGRLSARARSNRRHSGEASKTMDYKSVFTNLCLELQQNRSWIKGLGKNPFTHSIPFTHSLTAVPFVRGHRSVFPRTPRNTGVYVHVHVIQRLSQPRVACWHGFRQNSQKTECVFTRCPTCGRKKFACIHGLRSEGVKEVPGLYQTHCK